MGARTETLLVIIIVSFLILLVWSRVMKQTMMETILEIKEIVTNITRNE